MFLAKNIRYLRKRAGLSQLQIAEKFGYDNYTTVQKWESEKSDPPIKVVRGLAEFFSVNIDDLVLTDLERSDNMGSRASGMTLYDLTEHEAEHIRRYRYISEEGRRRIDAALNLEYDMLAEQKGNVSSA